MAPAERTRAGSVQGLTSLTSTQFDTKGDPPAYGAHPQDTCLFTSTSATVNLKLNPTNFLYINGNYSSTKSASYFIDPSLHIPEAYLPPLKDINVDAVGERMNMYLHIGGDLDLDLWVAGRKDSDAALNPIRRTKMHVGSRKGSLTVRVNAIDNIHPFSLELVSQDKLTVFIPRSFHGNLILSTQGECKLSNGILRNCTVLGALGKKRMYFVGNFSPVVSGSGSGVVEWTPDELTAETKDKDVMVKYVDEVELAVSKQDEVTSVVSKRRFWGGLSHTHS